MDDRVSKAVSRSHNLAAEAVAILVLASGEFHGEILEVGAPLDECLTKRLWIIERFVGKGTDTTSVSQDCRWILQQLEYHVSSRLSDTIRSDLLASIPNPLVILSALENIHF